MGRPVQCYVYDMTGGMAKTVGRLAGEEMEGVWHSSLVFGGVEYFYGYGLQQATPGSTPFGIPLKTIELGETEMPEAMVQDLLEDLKPRYQPQDYSFMWHNCNHFCNELSLLLTGNPVPEYLTNQGNIVLQNPILKSFLPLFEQMEAVTGSATAEGFVDADGNLMEGATPGQAFINAATARLSSKQKPAAAATPTNAPVGGNGAEGAGASAANSGSATPLAGRAASHGDAAPSAAAEPSGVATAGRPQLLHAAIDAVAHAAKQGAGDGPHAAGGAAARKAVKGGVPALPPRRGGGAVA